MRVLGEAWPMGVNASISQHLASLCPVAYCTVLHTSGPFHFRGLFDTALQDYEKMTNITLAQHPLKTPELPLRHVHPGRCEME
jgi:hypothetical protein